MNRKAIKSVRWLIVCRLKYFTLKHRVLIEPILNIVSHVIAFPTTCFHNTAIKHLMAQVSAALFNFKLKSYVICKILDWRRDQRMSNTAKMCYINPSLRQLYRQGTHRRGRTARHRLHQHNMHQQLDADDRHWYLLYDHSAQDQRSEQRKTNEIFEGENKFKHTSQ